MGRGTKKIKNHCIRRCDPPENATFSKRSSSQINCPPLHWGILFVLYLHTFEAPY